MTPTVEENATVQGLLPCPFCGTYEDDEVIWSDDLYVEEEDYGIQQRTYWVHCSNCGCDGPSGLTKQTAIIEWNRRLSE